MEREPHKPIEQMELFERYIQVADWCWRAVSHWRPLAADTVGKQLIRAVDSVGANLVEGDGRYTSADTIHFWIMARASAREAKYWLERASTREILPALESKDQIALLSSATQMLNALIRYRRSRQQKRLALETSALYLTGCGDSESWESCLNQEEDPFTAAC